LTVIDIRHLLEERAARINAALDRFLPSADTFPTLLHEAMRYAVLSSGKRLRPTLVLESFELFSKRSETPMPAACAFECVHAYSLVHDDLPAMDDDELRRGLPTVHAKYGEAMAILVGDALLTFAFQLMTERVMPQDLGARAALELARAAGSLGMVGGQALDMKLEGATGSEKEYIRNLHRMKTGAMIAGAVRAGAIIGRADANSFAAIATYGEKIGLAFQIVDDILDVTSTSEELGKAAGKDAAAGKITFPGVFSLEKSKAEAKQLVDDAVQALKPFGDRGERLISLAEFIVKRTK
jgi:geranylgeranyl diphosphate synthase type II